MAIPNFDHNHVLPPHIGDPRDASQLSPYPATSEEICRRFATSHDRCIILRGWLEFRERCTQLQVTHGFQWLAGSFLEDIERSENRSPRDVDVTTFYFPTGDPNFTPTLYSQFTEFRDHHLSKNTYHVDHFPINLVANPVLTVEATRYWTGLFSHRRDGVWKGMLRVDLNTPAHDSGGLAFLNSIP